MAIARHNVYPERPFKPFSLIFFIELWERFGWYGMQAILIYFMIKVVGFPDATADHIFGAFTALAYAFLSVGGYIGDNILGSKRTTIIGAFVLAFGYMILALNPQNYLFWGLGTIIAGNAIFKSNPSTLVTKLFRKEDHRVESAFTLYYMAINVGSFMSSLSVPSIARHFGWNVAFGVSFIGLFLAIASFIFLKSMVAEVGSEPDFRKVRLVDYLKVIGVIIALILISAFLLEHIAIAKLLLGIILVLIVILCVRLLFKAELSERKQLAVALILILEAISFYILNQQRATSINLFTIRNTIHTIFCIPLDPLAFQSFNSFWILFTSPILAYFFHKSAKKGKQISIPYKFAFGMFLCSLGFLIMKFAALFFADSQGKIAGEWLFLAIGLMSIGEIFISGIGLAMIAKLVPQKIMGLMMGIWFMATAVAMLLGAYVAAFASIPKEITDPILTLPIYTNLFFKIGLATLIMSIIMALTAPILKKYIINK